LRQQEVGRALLPLYLELKMKFPKMKTFCSYNQTSSKINPLCSYNRMMNIMEVPQRNVGKAVVLHFKIIGPYNRIMWYSNNTLKE